MAVIHEMYYPCEREPKFELLNEVKISLSDIEQNVPTEMYVNDHSNESRNILSFQVNRVANTLTLTGLQGKYDSLKLYPLDESGEVIHEEVNSGLSVFLPHHRIEVNGDFTVRIAQTEDELVIQQVKVGRRNRFKPSF